MYLVVPWEMLYDEKSLVGTQEIPKGRLRCILSSFRVKGLLLFAVWGLIAVVQADTKVPVFDIVATPSVDGSVLTGTFRIWDKQDYAFTQADQPRFFMSSHDPLDHDPNSGPLAGDHIINKDDWRSVTPTKLYVQQISDPMVSPVTSAIAYFEIPVPEDLKATVANGRGSLAVIMGALGLEQQDPINGIGNTKAEWSFAVCSLTDLQKAGPDTNNVVPIGLFRKYIPAKDSDTTYDHVLWFNDYFSSWDNSGVNSRPRGFGIDGPLNEQTIWLDGNWNKLPGLTSQEWRGTMKATASHTSHYRYVCLYCADVSDFEGRKHFQISGVIRDTSYRP
jgi:hypothetical protein